MVSPTFSTLEGLLSHFTVLPCVTDNPAKKAE